MKPQKEKKEYVKCESCNKKVDKNDIDSIESQTVELKLTACKRCLKKVYTSLNDELNFKKKWYLIMDFDDF